jgi:hypothetical protein
MFENRLLRRIFRPELEDVTGEWITLHDEELRNIYSSSCIIRIINLRKRRWSKYVDGMRKM